MRRPVALLAALLAVTLAGPLAPAAAAPLYDVKATWGDTNLTPGGAGQFLVQVRNIGDEASEEELTITDEFPEGVEVTGIHMSLGVDYSGLCSGVGTGTLECSLEGPLLAQLAAPPGRTGGNTSPTPAGYLPTIYVNVAIDPGASGVGTNAATVAGGGAVVPAIDTDQVRFGETPAPFGLVPGSFLADVFTAAYPGGAPTRLASDRPFEMRVQFDFTARTGVNDGPGEDGTRYTAPTGQPRTVEVTLPRGMIGNPEALPKCDPTDFAERGTVNGSTACPANTQVGYLNIPITDSTKNYGKGQIPNPNELLNRVPIYNLEPPKGALADFGFTAGGLVQAHIYPVLDSAQNYAIKAVTPNISSLAQPRGSEVTIWGVPGDPAHDKFRYPPEAPEGAPVIGTPFGGAPIRPFLTNPMDCGVENGGARIRLDSYEHPGQFTPAEEYPDPLNVEKCDDPDFQFEPAISLQPTSLDAGGPTGLDVHLEVPQRNDEVEDATELYAANGNAKAIATPPVKKAVVTLPEGMTISPSAAQGLGACSSAQIGLGTDAPVTCPDNSRYGTLTLHTPTLPADKQPEGSIYIAKQNDHPFPDTFLAVYLVIQEPDRGLLVKLPGRVDLDPDSGQIKTTFEDLPQFPVDDFQLTLKGGVRAALVNPQTCGKKTIRAEFFSWHDPKTPHLVEDSYQVTQKADGSPCVSSLAERLFAPLLDAGTENNSAGSYSPFSLELTRTDDDQEFSQLALTLPQGLVPKIAGVGECPDAGIAQAEDPGRSGTQEQLFPSCPASSLIGTTDVGAGVGVPLTYVPGNVYLAGPYKGAPLSVVVITPAVVGPYDLGVIAVRSAAHVDPETTQATIASDPFPLIFKGIPVRLRDIRVKVDRPEFMRNPTSCAEKQIRARVMGAGGDMKSTADDTAAEVSERFQAGRCASLAFKPKLSFRLFGGTRRGAHPKLRAVLRMPEQSANIASASVALPRSEFLDQGHIRTVCTRVQFAARQCPEGSVYGNVRAKSPLLDEVVEGPIYLRSSSNTLPDLVFALKGKVDVDVVGRIDSVRGGIRSTFEMTPDVPISWAVFTFQGGKKGLLVNSRNLCKGRKARATAHFTAHSGKRRTLRPAMRSSCGKAKKKNSRKRVG